MNLDLLKNQKNIIDFLNNAKSKSRLTHAYIFEGKKGVGKNELAHYFACLLYSDNKVDLDSQYSKLILTDQFLNLFVIYPDGKNVKKDQIIALHEEFSKTSQISGPRIYIINEADKMNVSSQNSLLKFIEEPPSGVYGILCTTNSKGLLPTILSRCQTLRLNELDNNIIRKSLIKEGIDKEVATLLSFITNDIEDGIELAKDANLLKAFELFKSFFKIKNDKDSVKYFLEVNKYITDNAVLKSYITLLIILYEDLLYLYKGNFNIKLEIYADKIEKIKEKISEEKALSSIDYLYKISNMLDNSNVSIKNIITNLTFNLI